MGEEIHRRLEVVVIEEIPTPINTIRVNTIKEVATKYPGIKILDSQPGNWNKKDALSVMENYLQKYRKIDGVITLDDDMLAGALQAVREAGRRDIRAVMGGACMKEMVKRIMDGDPLVKANVTYPPDVCATAVSLAVLGIRNRVFEGFYQKKLPVRIISSAELVTKDNARSYYFPDAPF